MASRLRRFHASQPVKRNAIGSDPIRIGFMAPRKSIVEWVATIFSPAFTVTSTRRYDIWHSLNSHCHGELSLLGQLPGPATPRARLAPYSNMWRRWSNGLV